MSVLKIHFFFRVLCDLISTKSAFAVCPKLTDLYVALLEVEINHEIVKDQKGGKLHTKSTQKDMLGSENKAEVLFEGPELISECEYKEKPSQSL